MVFIMIKLLDFPIELDLQQVLKQMDCREDSPLYHSLIAAGDQLRNTFSVLIHPKALLSFGTLPGHIAAMYQEACPAAFVLITLGKEVSDFCDLLFRENEYVKGLLVNSMADYIMFQMEQTVLSSLKEQCLRRGFGVDNRLEALRNAAPGIQKLIWEETNAAEELGIRLLPSNVFDPIKTLAFAFALTTDTAKFHAGHDCSLCTAKDCSFQYPSVINIKVLWGSITRTVFCQNQESIREALLRQGIDLNSPCGGKGLCGKCTIRVTQGTLPITPADRSFFGEADLNRGCRLACLAYPQKECTILIPDGKNELYSIPDTPISKSSLIPAIRESGLVMGIDIGTTTLAVRLVDSAGNILDTYTAVNHQASYGADVLSRIQASIEGYAEALKHCIQADLTKGIHTILSRTDTKTEWLSKIIIAGNTTMLHLLMGLSCESLGSFPFTPVTVSAVTGSIDSMLGEKGMDASVTLLPGVSAYIGSDVVAGLFSCGFFKLERPCLFLDLGTNAEMALGQKDRLFFASAAAGPAFEGGNISWGMGSVPGAICSVTLTGSSPGQLSLRTIADAPPVGICGTGIIEITAELLRIGIIDETGLLTEPYFDTGYPLAVTSDGRQILFTQKDIRNVQLAKSAIRAGLEILLKHAALTMDGIDTLYLAGGFGYRLDPQKALAIGLLPDFSSTKKTGISAVGNSSLNGAAACGLSNNFMEPLEHIIAIGQEIILSDDPDFQELYIAHMNF